MKDQFKFSIALFLLGFFLLPTFTLSAEVYKWKDKDGKIHYSDTPPPPGVDAEIKKFKEPQAPQSPQPSKEKQRPKADPPEPQLDTPPQSRAETATKKSRTEPTTKENPRIESSLPKSKDEAYKERRPYENIHVIMYMTAW